MASPSKAPWIVAASVYAVEALKDQAGLCRWNYALRSVQQRAKSHLGSFSMANGASSNSSSPSSSCSSVAGIKKANKSEESWDKVVYLSSWGPN